MFLLEERANNIHTINTYSRELRWLGEMEGAFVVCFDCSGPYITTERRQKGRKQIGRRWLCSRHRKSHCLFVTYN